VTFLEESLDMSKSLRTVMLAQIMSVMLFTICGVALADRVRCPVCAQVFSDDIKYCPNDGTNLVLDGRRESAEKKRLKDQVDDPKEPLTEEKYTRHDQGGDRQRSDDRISGNYSDRRRRIGTERRGPDSAAEKRRKARSLRREFEQKDKEIRSEYKEKLNRMWRARHDRAREDLMARRGLYKLRKRSLWGRGAPLTSVGMRLSWMEEAADAGQVTGAELDFNLSKTKVRVGLSTFIGIRRLSERGDLVFLENVSVGMQYPWRFSPYIVARGGLGTLISNRFGVDITYLIRTLGLEGGVDCRITKAIVITPSFGYIRCAIDNVYWNSFTAKLAVGF